MDDGDHRFPGAVLVIKLKGGFSGFDGDEWIENDQPRVPFHNSQVGQVGVSNLVETINHFKEAALENQLRLPPQTGIDRIGGRTVVLYETETSDIPNDATVIGFNHAIIRQRGNETA
ncbi:MAG: hypothetical protein U0452_03540 [Anaerolineae bacterium]